MASLRTRQLSPAACLALALIDPAEAGERVQGLFCNTADQIDAALVHVAHGVPPREAAELLNRDQVVCTSVDRLAYVVENPVGLGSERIGSPVRYRAALVGVLAGDRLRPVSPPVEVFFITPGPLAAVVERRI